MMCGWAARHMPCRHTVLSGRLQVCCCPMCCLVLTHFCCLQSTSPRSMASLAVSGCSKSKVEPSSVALTGSSRTRLESAACLLILSRCCGLMLVAGVKGLRLHAGHVLFS